MLTIIEQDETTHHVVCVITLFILQLTGRLP